MDPQTRTNLLKAMRGEAFAFVKYTLFAEQARQNGREELAKLYESTAKMERFEHFAEEAELAWLVGDDRENLKNAIRGENREVETMYPQFAQQAADAGEEDAAARFAEVARDEMKHREAFKEALQKLENDMKSYDDSDTPRGVSRQAKSALNTTKAAAVIRH